MSSLPDPSPDAEHTLTVTNSDLGLLIPAVAMMWARTMTLDIPRVALVLARLDLLGERMMDLLPPSVAEQLWGP